MSGSAIQVFKFSPRHCVTDSWREISTANGQRASQSIPGDRIRSLQRHKQSGRISVRYERNKRATMTAIYGREELKFKQALRQTVNKPAIAGSNSTALARIPQAEDFPRRLLEALEAIRSKQSSHPPASLAEKLTLSLSEASQVAGLSRNMLTGYIKSKKLKAQSLGRGWKVKRANLEAFIKSL